MLSKQDIELMMWFCVGFILGYLYMTICFRIAMIDAALELQREFSHRRERTPPTIDC